MQVNASAAPSGANRAAAGGIAARSMARTLMKGWLDNAGRRNTIELCECPEPVLRSIGAGGEQLPNYIEVSPTVKRVPVADRKALWCSCGNKNVLDHRSLPMSHGHDFSVVVDECLPAAP